MLIVSKFGGTSMGDAKCMRQAAQVCIDRQSNLIVVSATSGTTNQLIALSKTAEIGTEHSWTQTQQLLTEIEHKHRTIAQNLQASPAVVEHLDLLLSEMRSLAQGIHLLRDCSAKAMDTMMSFGERLSSKLFTYTLQTVLQAQGHKQSVLCLDARTIIKTSAHFGKAQALTELIHTQCKSLITGLNPQWKQSTLYVTQGFIGSTEQGHTTTLGRGGSDYSAALFAEGVRAEILEIWTDVPGIATTDPRLVPTAKPIPEISFTEASELATFGAKILHPATLLPALRRNIPVFVGSTFDPQQVGTWVRMQVSEQPLVRALALRKKQVLVTLSTPEMLNTHGFLYRVFKLFNDHQVSVDAITTSEISLSMTLDDSALLNTQLRQELALIADIQVEENLSLVSLIGNNINHTPGLAKKIFTSIEGINVRMICLGASKHNFCFLVDEQAGPLAIQRLHAEFC